jgi:hypothetical protein
MPKAKTIGDISLAPFLTELGLLKDKPPAV